MKRLHRKIKAGDDYEFMLTAYGFPLTSDSGAALADHCLNAATIAVQRQPKRRLRRLAEQSNDTIPTEDQDEEYAIVQLAVERAVAKVIRRHEKKAYVLSPTPQVLVDLVAKD